MSAVRVGLGVGCLALALAVGVAHAQEGEDDEIPAEILNYLGGEKVIEALGSEGFDALLAACPQEAVPEIVTCLKTNAAAQKLITAAQAKAKAAAGTDAADDAGDPADEPGADPPDENRDDPDDAGDDPGDDTAGDEPADEKPEPPAAPPAAAPVEALVQAGPYPKEALDLLPKEALDEIPKLLTHFYQVDDYKALLEICPTPELQARIQCLEKNEEALTVLYARRVVESLLALSDVELPRRLTVDQYDAIAEACIEPLGTYADCTYKHSVTDMRCSEHEDKLAKCIVKDEVVQAAYQAIQKERKEAFGPELYVEALGLVSQITLEEVRQIRKDCPQTDKKDLFACFEKSPLISKRLEAFATLSTMVIAAASQQLVEAGKPALTEEQAAFYGEQLMEVLLTFPLHVVTSLSNECDKKLGMDKITAITDLDRSFMCIAELAQTDPVSNPAYIDSATLTSWLEVAREKVIDKIQEKDAENQAKAFNTAMLVMLAVSLLGFLLVLLLPVFLRGRIKESGGSPFKASAVAAATFLGTMLALTGMLMAVKFVQSELVVEATSPKLRVVEAAFDVLERPDSIEGLSDMSKYRLDFVKTPLRGIVQASKGLAAGQSAFAMYLVNHWIDLLNQPELKRLSKNVSKLGAHVEAYKTILGIYGKTSWLLALLPVFLGLLAAVMYLLPLRQTLVDIAVSPVSGGSEEGPGKTLMAELKILGPFLLTLIITLPLIGVFIALAVEPVVELLLNHALQAVFYLLYADASIGVLYASIGTVILLLVLVLVLYILATIFVLGTMRKLLNAKFHDKQAWGAHKPFLAKGSLATFWVLLFPVLIATGALMLWEALVVPELDVTNLSTGDMVAVPLGACVAFIVLFWLLRGLAALKYVKGYKPGGDPAPAPETAAAPA